MLESVKLAMRISTDKYNDELTSLIESAKLDLGIAGVLLLGGIDDLAKRAIITYCRLNFGSPSDYDRLKKAYDEQKMQLSMATGYTDWGDDNAES